jgi:hypothetical protein
LPAFAAEEDADVTFFCPLLHGVENGRLSEQTAVTDATLIPETMSNFWQETNNF